MFVSYPKYSIDQIMAEGDQCYALGKFTEAIQFYNQGLKRDRKNVVLLVKKGNTLLQLGKTNKAYDCYFSAVFHAKLLNLIDQFIVQDQVYIERDIQTLTDLLRYKYGLPIMESGLKLILRRMQQEMNDDQQIKEWRAFEKKLDRKHLHRLEDVVDMFINQFGENYVIHFFSLYCYLWKFKDKTLTKDQLIDMIHHQKLLLELELFERRLKAGFRKEGKSLDGMTGVEFERYLAQWFRSQGYAVTLTPRSHDKGTDLLLTKFGITIVVQAKRWKQKVRTTAIQEAATAQKVHRADKALVVITSTFTIPAEKLAKQVGVILWDRKQLLKKMNTSQIDLFASF